jgi:hypothetical protein
MTGLSICHLSVGFSQPLNSCLKPLSKVGRTQKKSGFDFVKKRGIAAFFADSESNCYSWIAKKV